MKVKKSNGKIFGANLTAAEKKAMDIEIRRSIDDYNRQNMNEIDAMVLWHLHEEFGFGSERLNKFSERFTKIMNSHAKTYDDVAYEALIKHAKECGVNIEFD